MSTPHAGNGPGRWVLLSYRLPREPSTPRIGVWRKLERLGVARVSAVRVPPNPVPTTTTA